MATFTASSAITALIAGYAHTCIVTPGLIYGLGSGMLYDTGIAKRVSIQIPSLIRASIDRKRSGMVGPGKSVWPNVHLDDGEPLGRAQAIAYIY